MERIFDDLNNSFGWNRLPKSFMNENTVFLLITALIRNFYQFLVQAGDVVHQKMLIERIGAVSGYDSHKEIDFGSKLALSALLADFRITN